MQMVEMFFSSCPSSHLKVLSVLVHSIATCSLKNFQLGFCPTCFLKVFLFHVDFSSYYYTSNVNVWTCSSVLINNVMLWSFDHDNCTKTRSLHHLLSCFNQSLYNTHVPEIKKTHVNLLKPVMGEKRVKRSSHTFFHELLVLCFIKWVLLFKQYWTLSVCNEMTTKTQ